MHIFLTGEIQVGKSTIIRKYIELIKPRVGGFMTVFGTRFDDCETALYIVRADGTDTFSCDNLVFHRNKVCANSRLQINTQAFESAGCSILADVSGCDLIIMDELGIKEYKATGFQHAVLELLSGDTPILGVVKKHESPFLDKVRNHPNVRIITVTPDNREDILYSLTENYKGTDL